MIKVDPQFKMPNSTAFTAVAQALEKQGHGKQNIDAILKVLRSKIDFDAILKKKVQDTVKERLSSRGHNDESINNILNAIMGYLK